MQTAESLSDLELNDKVLQCADCGADFVFTAGEQEFFRLKQFKNDPKRCQPCKAKLCATAPPIPPLAPITNTLFCLFSIMFLLVTKAMRGK